MPASSCNAVFFEGSGQIDLDRSMAFACRVEHFQPIAVPSIHLNSRSSMDHVSFLQELDLYHKVRRGITHTCEAAGCRGASTFWSAHPDPHLRPQPANRTGARPRALVRSPCRILQPNLSPGRARDSEPESFRASSWRRLLLRRHKPSASSSPLRYVLGTSLPHGPATLGEALARSNGVPRRAFQTQYLILMAFAGRTMMEALPQSTLPGEQRVPLELVENWGTRARSKRASRGSRSRASWSR